MERASVDNHLMFCNICLRTSWNWECEYVYGSRALTVFVLWGLVAESER
jgi:hypothetical protein